MNNDEIRPNLLLALQVSLLGMITSNVRGITCGWDNNNIVIKHIFESNFSDEDVELCEEVASEVIASFPHHNIETHQAFIPLPDSIDDEFLSAWVYLRREN